MATSHPYPLVSVSTRICVVALLVLFLNTIFAVSTPAVANPVPFIDIVSPVSIPPGSTGVTITVRGANFIAASVVHWNGIALTTTFVNSKELTATVPDTFVAAVGLGSITVVSPSTSGITSNVMYLPVAATLNGTAFPTTASSTVGVGTTPHGIATGDFNGDGKIDLAVANSDSDTVTILLGNGNGTFTAQAPVSVGTAPNWLVTGDFNGDGKLDLAVVNSSEKSVTILMGVGDGTFTTGATLTVDDTPQVLVIGDFNEDGKLDIAVSNEASNTVSLLLGNGNGTFQSETSTDVGGSGFPIGLIAADFNGDGHLDVAAVNASDVAILLGSGAGGLTLGSNPTAGANLISGVFGDYNGDGKIDVVVVDQTLGQAFLFPGNGNGTFASAISYTTAEGTYSAATADFNGDGGLDLAFTNSGSANVSIFLQTLPVNLSPASLSFGSQPVGVSSIAQDVTLTNNTGATLNISGISFGGVDPGEFTKVTTCGATVPKDETCTISIKFSPTSTGAKTAVLSVTDDAGNSPQTLGLSGTGAMLPPVIAKSFGAATIPLNGTTSLSFTITNPASNTAALTNVAFTDSLPSGLLVATPGSLTGTCGGGTISGGDGSPTISLSGATLAASGSCTFSFNVTGTTAGVKNNSVQVTSTEGGTGNTSNASVTVIGAPVIVKAFGAASIPLNGSTSLTFTVQNNNTGTALSGVAFSDTLPAGLVVSTPNGLTGSCGGGTITATQGSGVVSLSGASLAQSTSCTFAVNVTGTTAGAKNNTTGAVTSTEGGTGGTASASVNVVAPPSIAKVFNPTGISLNATTSLTFTITNPVSNAVALTGVAFTDTLPTGLTVSNASATVCGGTVTVTAPTGIALTGATISTGSQCQFSITVTGAASGQYTNTTGSVTSTNGGTGNTATANLSVATPPTITKSFGAATIPLNGTTSLTFSITNPGSNAFSLTGIAFTDSLPAGLVVATPSGLSNTCGGTATAVAGSGSISLSGGTIAASSNCTLVANVTGTVSGNFTNTTGSVSSTNGGTGNTATANLSSAGPPSITKSFGAASVFLNGSTSLTFTVTNPASNSIALNGIAFTDSLPAGLIVATPNGLVTTCTGNTTATQGASSISLSSSSLAPNTSCTISANVVGSTAGVKNNSVQVTSTEGGTGNTSNASLTVTAPPVLTNAFGAASVPLNGSTSLTFTVQNNNTSTTLNGIGFSDALPAGLVVSTPNGLTGSCGGGTITATQGTGTVSLAAASLAQSGSCTFSVNVTGSSAGAKNNTTGNVTSTEGGTGSTASSSLEVVAPPTIAKSFAPTAIALNGTSALTLTITNPGANAVALTGVSFTDTFPLGVVVSTPNGLSNSCGGTATAVAGSGAISLTGATLAASSNCTVTVNVTGVSAGIFTNTTGAVASTNGDTGNTASANLNVASAPTVTNAFGAATIPLNGSTTLSFTVANPNSTLSLSGVNFIDSLPAGLVISSPNGLTTNCGAATITAVAGSGSVSLSGDTLAASGSCTFGVNVTGTSAGAKANTTGAISATESGAGTVSNTATVTVLSPPTLAEAFGAASINLGASTSLTFTLNNPNATTGLTGVGFTDTLPAGLVISTPNGVTGSCGGGTITATAGSNALTLAGGTIAASGSCVFSANVTSTAGGNQVNTTGTVTSTNGGTGDTATASLSVLLPDLTVAGSHSGNFSQGQTGAAYLITASNNGSAPTVGTVTVTDTLPASLTATAMAGTGWTCTVATVTCTRSDALAIGASYPAITLTVNVSGTAPTSVTNTTTVSGGGELNTANDTASDVTAVNIVPPDFSVAATPPAITVRAGGNATFTFTFTPLNNVPFSTAIALTTAGVPANTRITLQPATVTPGGSPATQTLVIMTSANDRFLTQNRVKSSPLLVAGIPFGGIVFLGLLFRRKNGLKGISRYAAVLIFVGTGLALYGCASASKFQELGTPPGAYTVTVTASGGSVQHSATITLTVQP